MVNASASIGAECTNSTESNLEAGESEYSRVQLGGGMLIYMHINKADRPRTCI
jgi:hypothetical protein